MLVVSKRNKAIATVNTVLLVFVLMVCAGLYTRYTQKHKAFLEPSPDSRHGRIVRLLERAFENDGNGGNQQPLPEETKQIIRDFHTFLKEAAAEFIFGDPNAPITNFIRNLFQSRFQLLGRDTAATASVLLQRFVKEEKSPLCYQPMKCPAGNVGMWCPDVDHASRKMVYCNYEGEIVNCARHSCIGAQGASVISYVESVGSILSSSWKDLNRTSDDTPAAFSNGVFRLNSLLDWVRTQVQLTPLENLASESACGAFVKQVRSIDWTGTFNRMPDGEWTTYDYNHLVAEVSNYVLQACSAVRGS